MELFGELALIFGLCLAGEGLAALLPVAFPPSVISLVLLLALLAAGIVRERHIGRVSHFLVANMAFFFIPSFVGTLEHLELIRRQLLPLLVIVGLTTPLVYLAAGWTVQLLTALLNKKGGTSRD